MGIWSHDDHALSERQMADSGQYCSAGFRFETLPDGGHWLPLTWPETVIALITDFVSESGCGS
jgi:pimeloyl-ACP methyl ester carboxylesterase